MSIEFDKKVEDIEKSKIIINQKIKSTIDHAERKLKLTEQIKYRIFAIIIGIVILLLAVLTIMSNFFAQKSTISALKKSTLVTAEVSADMVYDMISNIKSQLEGIAYNPYISDPSVNDLIKDKLILKDKDKISYIRANEVPLSGKGEWYTVTNEEMLEAISNGKTYVSSPLYNDNGELIFQFAVPVYDTYKLKDNPDYNLKVIGGLIFDFDATILSDITETVHVGENGTSYIIDSKGVTIASSKNFELVKNMVNTSLDPNANENIVVAELDMIKGNIGFTEYTWKNDTNYLAYAPVGDIGWSMAIDLETKDFLGELNKSKIFSVIISILGIIFASFISFWYSNKISRPIVKMANASKSMAEGNFNVFVDVKSKDEIGILAEAFILSLQNMKAVVNDMTRVMKSLENKNFNTYTEAVYVGDFENIEKSIHKVRNTVSHALKEIQKIGNQVSAGAEQVAASSQILAQGAAEQASAITELSETISNIYDQVKSNNENAEQAANRASNAGFVVEESNKQMTELMEAMENITNKSNEINKIVKTIDDIAFQTNILALNAAVEAARAGTAGKGFAVVADEVRNLAAKSAEAAKNTTLLIGQTTEAISGGKAIAERTAKSLQDVVSATDEVVSLVNEISDASSSQSTAISQITLGVEQISSVVQTNSATAEESAASAEELNAHSRVLEELIKEFKVRD